MLLITARQEISIACKLLTKQLWSGICGSRLHEKSYWDTWASEKGVSAGTMQSRCSAFMLSHWQTALCLDLNKLWAVESLFCNVLAVVWPGVWLLTEKSHTYSFHISSLYIRHDIKRVKVHFTMVWPEIECDLMKHVNNTWADVKRNESCENKCCVKLHAKNEFWKKLKMNHVKNYPWK